MALGALLGPFSEVTRMYVAVVPCWLRRGCKVMKRFLQPDIAPPPYHSLPPCSSWPQTHFLTSALFCPPSCPCRWKGVLVGSSFREDFPGGRSAKTSMASWAMVAMAGLVRGSAQFIQWLDQSGEESLGQWSSRLHRGPWDIGLANDDSYSEEGEGCSGYREYGGVGEWRWYLGAEGPCPPLLPTWARETGTTRLSLPPCSCKIGTK